MERNTINLSYYQPQSLSDLAQLQAYQPGGLYNPIILIDDTTVYSTFVEIPIERTNVFTGEVTETWEIIEILHVD